MDRRKTLILEELEYCEVEFKNTGNPIYVWRGYMQARMAGIDTPDWVLNHFDEIAGSVFDLSNDFFKSSKVSRSTICAAVKLSPSDFKAIREPNYTTLLAHGVARYLHQCASLDQACYLINDELKRRHPELKIPSASTYRRAWIKNGHLTLSEFRNCEISKDDNFYKALMQCDNQEAVNNFFKNKADF